MQEPLLFNEAIKENIRYGNLEATDGQILAAAEQAHCLNFIQSSHDQLCVPEVKAQIAREFEEIVSKKVKDYANLSTLRQLADEGKLLTEETLLVKELLESSNDKALAIIDA